MGIECNCYLPSKVNDKFVYKGKCREKFLICEEKLSLCDAIYIGNLQQASKKIMDSHLSGVQSLLKNGLKSDSFDDHYGQHFKYTTSRMDLGKCMMFKVVKKLNPIVAMQSFTKLNCNLCME